MQLAVISDGDILMVGDKKYLIISYPHPLLKEKRVIKGTTLAGMEEVTIIVQKNVAPPTENPNQQLSNPLEYFKPK